MTNEKEITADFAIEYLLDDCEDCPENKDGECMTQSHCFEVKQMAIKALKDVSTKPVLEEATARHRATGATENVMIDKKRMQVYLKRCTAEICDAFGWDIEVKSNDEERSS